MIFHSYAFVFLFFPLVLIFQNFLLNRGLDRAAVIILLIASSLFYMWWEVEYILLIYSSVIFNFTMAKIVSNLTHHRKLSKALLVFGISTNLCALAYFKYAYFFAEMVGTLVGRNWSLGEIILPLAISFFTFQQISYLVDTYRRPETVEKNFVNYALFVLFFPHLIAGPLVHHSEIISQFKRKFDYSKRAENFAVGISIFFLGAFKKVFLADSVAKFANIIFGVANTGDIPLPFFDAWFGIAAYSLQIYFDFSGYSDMAIGLARMLGINLPINFDSPYQAGNITSFWRRWHQSLSRFLRDYLYVSLGGNRGGPALTQINLMITMLLGGLWHGASWNFVFWGFLHGAYLVVHKIFTKLSPLRLNHFIGQAITLFSVCIAWTFFRAENFSSAFRIVKSAFGINGLIASNGRLSGDYIVSSQAVFWIVPVGLIALFLPNTSALFSKFLSDDQYIYRNPSNALILKDLKWASSPLWAAFTVIVGILSIVYMDGEVDFIYFRF